MTHYEVKLKQLSNGKIVDEQKTDSTKVEFNGGSGNAPTPRRSLRTTSTDHV